VEVAGERHRPEIVIDEKEIKKAFEGVKFKEPEWAKG
jgi:hypothetical protein